MIDSVSPSIKILTMNPPHTIRVVIARLRNSVGTHVGKLVSVGNCLSFDPIGLLVLAVVLALREGFNISRPVVPRNSVLVVNHGIANSIVSVSNNPIPQ